MRTQTRVRGLQDIKNEKECGTGSRVSILGKLAQLEREKERISQERSNWQEKIGLIDARLAQIEEVRKRLEPLLGEQQERPRRRTERGPRSRTSFGYDQAPLSEVVTIRY